MFSASAIILSSLLGFTTVESHLEFTATDSVEVVAVSDLNGALLEQELSQNDELLAFYQPPRFNRRDPFAANRKRIEKIQQDNRQRLEESRRRADEFHRKSQQRMEESRKRFEASNRERMQQFEASSRKAAAEREKRRNDLLNSAFPKGDNINNLTKPQTPPVVNHTPEVNREFQQFNNRVTQQTRPVATVRSKEESTTRLRPSSVRGLVKILFFLGAGGLFVARKLFS